MNESVNAFEFFAVEHFNLKPAKEVFHGASGFPVAAQLLIDKNALCNLDFNLLQKQMYINIWQNAQYLLKKANQIIFVGYSMPLADFEFRFILTKYISPNTKIHVVLHESDKKEPGEKHEVAEDRYRSAFPKNDISFHYNGFTEFFNSSI